MYRKYLPWHMDTMQRMVAIKESNSTQPLGEEIVLLNWNVYKNNHALTWLEDFSHILHTHQPNVILFQEYKKMNYRSILDKHKEFGYGFFPNIMWQKNHFGLINAAKSDILDYSSFTSPEVEPFIKTPKITLQTNYKLHLGSTLSVINVHMINFVKIKKFLTQIAQIEQACASHQGSLILSGDFNTWNKKRMHILSKLTQLYGLQSVEFENNPQQKHPFPFPLDHVFYRDLQLQKQEVLQHINTSDHKPMIISFSTK